MRILKEHVFVLLRNYNNIEKFTISILFCYLVSKLVRYVVLFYSLEDLIVAPPLSTPMFIKIVGCEEEKS